MPTDEQGLLPRALLAGTAITAAGALLAIALMGPLLLGWIRYPTSLSAIWQAEAVDLVDLALMVPLLLLGAILHAARRPSAKYLLALPAMNLAYVGLGFGVGQEWGNPAYAGNSYEFAPLFLLLLPAALLLTLGSLSLFGPEDAPVLSRSALLRFAAVLVPFLLVFAVLWSRQVVEVMSTGTLSDGTYSASPVGFWLVRFLDLGITIPLGLLTPYLLLRRPGQAFPLAILFAGYMVTLGTTVVVMGGILWAHADPSVTGSNAVQLVIFPILAALAYWILYFLLQAGLSPRSPMRLLVVGPPSVNDGDRSPSGLDTPPASRGSRRARAHRGSVGRLRRTRGRAAIFRHARLIPPPTVGSGMEPLVEGVEAVTVHVTDIQRAREFYSRVLGLSEVSFNTAASRAAFALPGTTTLLTMHPLGPEEGGREPGTVSGIVFRHHDPSAACAEIQKRGGTIVDAPETFTNPLGTVTLGVFADPDGNQFVIRHIQPHAK